MELKPIDIRDFFDIPNPGLTAYLNKVRTGSEDIIETKFYRGVTMNKVLEKWDNIFMRKCPHYSGLVEFEYRLREKVGPMSVQKPLRQRMDDIGDYYSAIKDSGNPIEQSALNLVLKEFNSARGLRKRSVEHTLNKMRLNTNSGSPFFTKRRRVLSKTKDGMVTLEMQYIDGEGYLLCAIIGWRGQEGGAGADEVKQRVIWMMPFIVNLHELCAYQPLIEACQKFNLVPAWVSMDSVDYNITKLFDTKRPNDVIVCSDFEKFDQHFNDNMSGCAKEILRQLFTQGDLDDWLDNIFPIKYNIPMVLTEKLAAFGHHGMASGSGGTNADETLCHRALQHECANNNHSLLNPYSMCLGDDGIICYDGVNMDQVIQAYTNHGQVMNVEKQSEATDHCDYLRRWHSSEYRKNGITVGVYSTFRALGRLRYQERWYDPDFWGPKMVALRQLSILENVKYHPLNEEFVEFCMKGDRYRLGLDIPGFLDNIDAEAKKATDVMPDFLGYVKSEMKDRTGINDWWIVKYLKSRS